jgi:hypothetical protein
VHRNSVWIRNQLDVTFVLSFISLLQVAQHVSGNHVPIFRSWLLRSVIGSDSLPAATAQYQHLAITLRSRQLLKMGTWLPETFWATCKREIKDNTEVTSSWFLIHAVKGSCSEYCGHLKAEGLPLKLCVRWNSLWNTWRSPCYCTTIPGSCRHLTLEVKVWRWIFIGHFYPSAPIGTPKGSRRLGGLKCRISVEPFFKSETFYWRVFFMAWVLSLWPPTGLSACVLFLFLCLVSWLHRTVCL